MRRILKQNIEKQNVIETSSWITQIFDKSTEKFLENLNFKNVED